MLDPADKAEIDKLSRFEMCQLWRFAPTGYRLLKDEAGSYFKERFAELGGFSAEISKQLGWDPPLGWNPQ